MKERYEALKKKLSEDGKLGAPVVFVGGVSSQGDDHQIDATPRAPHCRIFRSGHEDT